jgi:hypothetical protein
LSPTEKIITVFNELEYLERLVKLVKNKRDEMLHLNWVAFVAPIVLDMRKININRSHNKTIHLLVEMNNYIIEGLIDIRASMSIVATK